MVEKKTQELVVAEYKLHIHCKECASAVHKHIVRHSGVEKVDISIESGKAIVKGDFDVKKVQERIEKKTKKKVELISSKFVAKEEKKEQEIKITVIKVHLHCENCERDLKVLLLKHKEIHKVETNLGDNSCKITGTIKETELVEYIQKKTHKVAKIVKVEVKEVKITEEKKDDKSKGKKDEFLKKIKLEIEKMKQELKEKHIEIEIDELFRKINVEREEKKELKVKEFEIEMDELYKKIHVEMEKKYFLMEKDVDIEELFKKIKVKIEEKKWELKEKYFDAPYYHHYAHAPSYIHTPSCYIQKPPCYIQKPPCYSHYTHAPQWFSDEDPNACVLM